MSENCTTIWKSFKDSLPLNGQRIKVKHTNSSKDDGFFDRVFEFEEMLLRINPFQMSCIMHLRFLGGSIQLCSCNIHDMKWAAHNENS